jgi:hypothetical protein
MREQLWSIINRRFPGLILFGCDFFCNRHGSTIRASGPSRLQSDPIFIMLRADFTFQGTDLLPLGWNRV